MDLRKIFCKVWLALGLLQTAMIFQAYDGNAAASPDLFSNEPSTQAEASGPQKTTSGQKPVRMSRTFFEKSLVGVVTVDSDETSSNVTWVEYPPTEAPPKGQVISDFRDRKGCAVYDDSYGLQLCFNIMPDVSSVGVNAKEVTLTGVCSEGGPEQVHFVEAGRANGQLTVKFKVNCGGRTRDVTLTLRQI